jgi:transposase
MGIPTEVRLALSLPLLGLPALRTIQPALRLLEQQGLRFEFLSAYSPELNRIETMWRFMKHRWMEVKRRIKAELERAVEHVFEHFCNQFKMEF